MTADVSQQVQHDVQDVRSQGTSGERLQSAMQDINTARDQFKNDPKDYADYMKGIQQRLADQPGLLPALELTDPQMKHDANLVRTMSANNDEIYKVLDTYGKNHGMDYRGGDGQVGTEDMKSFLDDAGKEGTKANELAKKNPELVQLLQQQNGQGFDKTALLDHLGYASQEEFNKANPAENVGKPIVLNGPSGKPETVVQQNGAATGIHYDASGNVDGVSTTKDGQTLRSMRDEQGQWVDENGNPSPMQAPFVKDGQMGFYTPDQNDPTKFSNVNIDLATGKESAEIVDQGYQVQPGDTLTDIARRTLGAGADADSPEVQAMVNQIAAASGIEDQNAIADGSKVVIPPGFDVPQTQPTEGEQPQGIVQNAIGEDVQPGDPTQPVTPTPEPGPTDNGKPVDDQNTNTQPPTEVVPGAPTMPLPGAA